MSEKFISASCRGERCSICGKDATKKVEETLFDDDPNPIRHPVVAYVCEEHFNYVMYGQLNKSKQP